MLLISSRSDSHLDPRPSECPETLIHKIAHKQIKFPKLDPKIDIGHS